jgi:RNA polymerase sigma-70 factor (ECF subfamily)
MQSTGRLNEGAKTEKCIDSEPNQTVETESVSGKERNSTLHEPCVPSETKTTSSMKIRGSPEGIETHREYLFNSALGRLRNREQAEDVVQETFLAAFTSLRRFMGESSERTWLTGILNHKVCDHLRRASRNRALFENLPLDDHCESRAVAHSVVGFTLPPRDPRTELESKELREALNAAIKKLPPRQARVYQLYELGFWSGREICRALQISDRNLWIILHRARKSLRQSLSQWRSMNVARRRTAPSAI